MSRACWYGFGASAWIGGGILIDGRLGLWNMGGLLLLSASFFLFGFERHGQMAVVASWITIFRFAGELAVQTRWRVWPVPVPHPIQLARENASNSPHPFHAPTFHIISRFSELPQHQLSYPNR